MRFTAVFFCILLASHSAHAKWKSRRFPPTRDVKYAGFSILAISFAPKAVIVICPGQNGDPAEMIREGKWEEFARRHGYGLVGFSMRSDNAILETGAGYFDATGGSGKILDTLLTEEFGPDAKVYLVGFSGGARFLTSYIEYAPKRVVGWLAHSASLDSMRTPIAGDAAPTGFVSCGTLDVGRYGNCLSYFVHRRSKGWKIAWISLENLGHRWEPRLTTLFQAFILSDSQSPVWMDIDKKEEASASTSPRLKAWLPGKEVADLWIKLHSP